MDSPRTEEDPALESEGNMADASSELEVALKDYIFKLEVGKLVLFKKSLCVQACKTFYECNCRFKGNQNAGGCGLSRCHCCHGHPTCIQSITFFSFIYLVIYCLSPTQNANSVRADPFVSCPLLFIVYLKE